MMPVKSSAIEAVGYDPTTRQMRIRFTGGSEYDFCGVPEAIYRDLMSAASKGSYYNDRIRDRYPCQAGDSIDEEQREDRPHRRRIRLPG
jgi:hypothetical protein